MNAAKQAAATLLRHAAGLALDGKGEFVAACVQLGVSDAVLLVAIEAWTHELGAKRFTEDRTHKRALALLAAAARLDREGAHDGVAK